MSQTEYIGSRHPATRKVSVAAGGEPLDPRADLMNHSPAGFEYGYGGSGPAQLALAILADHFARVPEDIALARKIALRGKAELPELPTREPDRLAVACHQAFKGAVVARLDGDAWRLTSADVTRALKKLAER